MRRILVLLLLAGCRSPEADRTRGAGPGADVGNRGDPVVMHEGSDPYAGTPSLIPAQAPPLEGATHARSMSRAK